MIGLGFVKWDKRNDSLYVVKPSSTSKALISKRGDITDEVVSMIMKNSSFSDKEKQIFRDYNTYLKDLKTVVSKLGYDEFTDELKITLSELIFQDAEEVYYFLGTAQNEITYKNFIIGKLTDLEIENPGITMKTLNKKYNEVKVYPKTDEEKLEFIKKNGKKED